MSQDCDCKTLHQKAFGGGCPKCNPDYQEPKREGPLSYHDLHITAQGLERASIFDLPYHLKVTCTRVGGWELWQYALVGTRSEYKLLAREYPENGVGGLRLDVAGHVIVDSLEQ